MLNRLIAPLRRTVGRPVRIAQAIVGDRSPELQQAGVAITLNVYDSPEDVTGLDYQDVLPATWTPSGPNGPTLRPAARAGVLPGPVDLPFETDGASFIFLKALSQGAAAAGSRSLWFEVFVRFDREVLLGGICYGGYPFLPYYVNRQGENVSNFGLPRELRLRWKGLDEGFIDDETAITSQEPTSHSGVHYLCTGPVRTDRVRLYLSDLPRFIQSIGQDKQGAPEFKERHGLLIPYLYFFTYSEGTRFKPGVPAGLLAALTRQQAAGPQPPAGIRPGADFFHQDGNSFAHMSGASMFAGRRTYTSGSRTFRECFCSPQLGPQDELRLYVEQGEEQPRCVAGIRLKFCVPGFAGALQRPGTQLKVYEVDPPEGVSPLNVINEENKKYRVVLFDAPVGAAQDTVVCKFARPSSARYFVLTLTNVTGQRGQVAIESAELVQSAHVSVAPRPSRTQTVSDLHYRIIGPGLADDYARLGAEGFSLTVERLVAGERKSVLFSAASLLDLLQSGGARLLANQRYRAATTYEEQTDTLPGGYDEHSTRAWSDGWRRSESGKDVSWGDPSAVTGTHDPSSGHGFSNFANSESRSHVELIGHEGAGVFFDDLRKLVNTITGAKEGDEIYLKDPGVARLLQSEESEPLKWEKVWNGTTGVGRVGAVSNLTIPPLFLVPENAAAGLGNAVRDVAKLIKDPTSFPSGPPFDDLLAMLFPAAIGPNPHHLFLNGLGVGLSGGLSAYVGVSLSLSCAQLLPQLVHNSSSGTTGNITKQASLTGYSYSQALHKGFDAARVRTELLGGSARRTVTRRERADETNEERRRGVEVKWQDSFVDIIAGTIPIGITLPATAGRAYRTADETLVVRLGSGAGTSVQVDVWFDVIEEVVRDDY